MVADIINAVIQMADSFISPASYGIMVGPMPANESIAIAPASGAPESTSIDKGQAMVLNVVLNGKSFDQADLAKTLSEIHINLTQATEYPDDGNFQITDIRTVALPHYLGREPDNQWLYGSSLAIRYYARKQ